MNEVARCDSCQALLTPGAPFCTTCWMPLPDPEPAAEAEPVGSPVVPDTVPAEWAPAPVAAGTPMAPPSFFAGPPLPAAAAPPQAVAPPVGAPPGWRPPAPAGGTLPVSAGPSGRTVKLTVVGVVVALVAVVGGVGFAAVRFVTRDDTKANAAKVFRQGDGGPVGDFMLGGSRAAALSAGPGERARAAAWLPTVEPAIQRMNTAIGEMQRTLDSWAGGDLADGPTAQAAKRFRGEAERFVEDLDIVSVPSFLAEDVRNLAKAAIDYQLAADALLLLIDGHKGLQSMSYGFTVGTANLAWDAGIETVYGAAGRAPAYRPNKP